MSLPKAVVVCGLVAVAVAVAGCRRVPAPGGATGSRADKARKEAEALAVAAATGAATGYVMAHDPPRTNPGGPLGRAVGGVAGIAVDRTAVKPQGVGVTPAGPPGYTGPAVKGTQQPKAAARPGSPPVIRERVASSIPYPIEADADEDALAVARDRIEQKLAELDPPVRYRPSPNEVKNEFVRKETRTVRPPSPAEQEFLKELRIDEKVYYVEYDVEVSADQVRGLRGRDRVATALRVLAGVSFASLLGFLFLRFDERTKGYLTRWLAVVAVLLAGGAAAALYLV